MSRNNETKLAGVQVVGYGHPTIFVIENVNDGMVAIMPRTKEVWQFDKVEYALDGLKNYLLKYLKLGAIAWAKGRPVREGDELVMPKPVVHPSQEAVAKATAHFEGIERPATKSPNFSAGFGQAVVDHAAKQTKQEAEIATLKKDVARLKIAVGQLNYHVLMGNYGR